MHNTYLSNLRQFHAMVRYVDGRTRRQTKIKTFRPMGKINKVSNAKIHKLSEEHGRNKSEIEQYKNDILNLRGPESESDHKRKYKRTHRRRPGRTVVKE